MAKAPPARPRRPRARPPGLGAADPAELAVAAFLRSAKEADQTARWLDRLPDEMTYNSSPSVLEIKQTVQWVQSRAYKTPTRIR